MSCPVVVFGAGAAAFVDLAASAGGSPDASGGHRVPLPPVAGFSADLRLFVVNTLDPSQDDRFWQHLHHTRWLVLSTPGPKRDRSWVKIVERLTRVVDAQRGDVSVALHGEAELGPVWRAYGGREPLALSSRPEPIVRAILRDFVKTVREV